MQTTVPAFAVRWPARVNTNATSWALKPEPVVANVRMTSSTGTICYGESIGKFPAGEEIFAANVLPITAAVQNRSSDAPSGTARTVRPLPRNWRHRNSRVVLREVRVQHDSGE